MLCGRSGIMRWHVFNFNSMGPHHANL